MSSTNSNEQEDYPLELKQRQRAPSTQEVQLESAITNKDLCTNVHKPATSTIGPNEVYQPDAMSKLVQTQKVQRTDFD